MCVCVCDANINSNIDNENEDEDDPYDDDNDNDDYYSNKDDALYHSPAFNSRNRRKYYMYIPFYHDSFKSQIAILTCSRVVASSVTFTEEDEKRSGLSAQGSQLSNSSL